MELKHALITPETPWSELPAEWRRHIAPHIEFRPGDHWLWRGPTASGNPIVSITNDYGRRQIGAHRLIARMFWSFAGRPAMARHYVVSRAAVREPAPHRDPEAQGDAPCVPCLSCSPAAMTPSALYASGPAEPSASCRLTGTEKLRGTPRVHGDSVR